ncbi:MAG: EAL domain-containing protein [gamma proteobacterium symbiont of Bathyaustriella thionipta]|nr:EAL domain-containing protein [gamma proteobacterium symbiont of Bathyaustriella thionipta]
MDIQDELSDDTLAEVIDKIPASRGGEAVKLTTAILSARDGSKRSIELAVSEMLNHSGQHIGMVMVLHDVTSERELSRQLSYEATHDALTGLINRYEFERGVTRLIENPLTDEDKHVLCYLDLEQFKVVNDTSGHVAGDALLKQITMTLKSMVRKRDMLARLGGDEFALLFEHCDLQHARQVVQQIIDAIREFRFVWEDSTFSIGCSFGIVPFTPYSGTLTSLLSEADAACYMAKDAGGNRMQIYRPDDDEMLQRHGEMRWVTRVTHALSHERLQLYGQPIKAIGAPFADVKYIEVLLRMRDEKDQVVSPSSFLPAAERYNLAPTLDRWVVEKSLQILADVDKSKLGISINLSGRSLGSQGFLQFVLDCLEKVVMEPDCLVFELTETAAISNLSEARIFMTELKKRGCRFALDDFGSGLSSFGYLKNLPVDILKIDGVFVRDIVDDEIDYAMVKSINDVGHVMGMKTVAEFVESEAILDALSEIGVDFVQGYAIAKPAPIEQWIEQVSKA